MKKIYIASPYTVGDPAKNVRRQIDAASILMDMGYAPFIPLLSHFTHMVHPKHYDEWIAWDLTWVKSCDALIRLKPLDAQGREIPSSGADMEEQEAVKNGIPVYTFTDAEDIQHFDPKFI